MTRHTADQSDGDLAARALDGDNAAFAGIVTRYKRALYRLVLRLIGDEDEALDIVQETFIAAHGALRRYDPDRSMRAWLARIAINKSRDWHRRRVVRRLISTLLPADAAKIAADTPAVDVLVADRAELKLVNAAIDRLPTNLREVLILRAVEGLSQTETAYLLGTTEKTVETRLYRARQKLKSTLDR